MTDGLGFRATMLDDRTIEMIVSGYPAADDLVDFIHATFPAATFSHVLWNFSGASLAMLDIADFRKLADAGREFVALRGPDPRTAVLVQSSVEVLLVRAYSAMTLELRPMAVHASTDRKELLDWLGVSD